VDTSGHHAPSVAGPDGLDAIFCPGGDTPGFTGHPVLVHVGLHKTATTWLQNQILKPKCGSEIVCCAQFRVTHSAFLLPRFGEFSISAALDRLAPYIDTAQAKGLPLVLSDEALGGFPFHHKYCREMAALRIKRALPQAKILVTVREQSAVLASMYGEYLKYGYSSTLPDFLAKAPANSVFHPVVDREFYNYDRILTLYGGLFGDNNVLVLPMEWMTRNSQAAIARISQFIGAPLSPPDGESVRRAANEAWSPAARTAARLLNRLHAQDSRWNQKRGWLAARLTPMSVAWRINSWSSRLGGARPSNDRAIVRAILGDHYAESNARFAERCEFDLEALGYTVTKRDEPA
jgi:hypothetical protein